MDEHMGAMTCIWNFHTNRGQGSGILKGYVGLSTAIFTDLCTALFSDDAASFLFMLAVIPLEFCFIAAFYLHESPPTATEEQEESRYFWVFNALAVVVAVHHLACDFIPSPSTVFSLVFVAILLVLLASPLAIPVYFFFKNRFGPGGDVEGQVREPLLVVEEKEEEEEKATESQGKEYDLATEKEVAGVKEKQVIGEEHTIMEALRTLISG